MVIDRRTAIIGVATFAAVGTAEGSLASQEPATASPMERVLGIGGFFFRSHDPRKLAEWYQVHLGVDPVPTDHAHKAWQQTAGPTAFAPFSMESKYLGPPTQAFMINFRVRSLDAMVAQLKKANIEVKVYPDDPSGKFAHLHDPDGNPIELWEPPTA